MYSVDKMERRKQMTSVSTVTEADHTVEAKSRMLYMKLA